MFHLPVNCASSQPGAGFGRDLPSCGGYQCAIKSYLVVLEVAGGHIKPSVTIFGVIAVDRCVGTFGRCKV